MNFDKRRGGRNATALRALINISLLCSAQLKCAKKKYSKCQIYLATTERFMRESMKAMKAEKDNLRHETVSGLLIYSRLQLLTLFGFCRDDQRAKAES
jgi:enamine deaminase RidA (YjgF/YER057c/UK114 family)